MRYFLTLALGCLFAGTVGCGTDDNAGVVAEIGWRLNYQTWTVPDNVESVEDLRDCENQPDTNYAQPYRSIAAVGVKVEDALRQVEGMERDYDCSAGFGGKRIDVKGLIRQMYELTIEAKDEDGTVLYEHFEPELDLTTLHTKTYELRAATGELWTYPMLTGDITCPAGVDTVRWSLFREIEDAPGTFETEATLTGSQSACTMSQFREVIIRRIPSYPVEGAEGGHTGTKYKVKLEVLTGTTVSYCTTVNRSIKPGLITHDRVPGLSDNMQLYAGVCP